jgi:hypothetical protein
VGSDLFLAIFISFLAISFKIANLGNYNIHPAVLFIVSFVFLILFGSICLMLPAATTKGITFMQALFTATSAVTVTGLAVYGYRQRFYFFWSSCYTYTHPAWRLRRIDGDQYICIDLSSHPQVFATEQ